MKTKTPKIKESMLLAVLASSLGVFISKLLGLLYYAPLNDIAGTANMSFYSIAYTYYDILLQVSSAGIPFAIATLIARYAAKDDYKTVVLVKKLGMSFVFALSFFAVFVFVLITGPLVRQTLGASATQEDIKNLKIVFYILIVAVLIVPYLSSLRGYYQGLKRLDLYGSSQVFEQFVRVFVIIFGSYLFVKILHFDSVWAIFVAIAAASIAALAAIFYIKLNTKSEDKRINELIKQQTSDAECKKLLIKEIVKIVIPYLAICIFGSASSLVNSTFYIKYATSLGRDYETSKITLAIIDANCAKLLTIPGIISTGFCSALVPYISESITVKDYSKLQNQLNQIIESVLYFLIPILIVYVFFSKELYFIMYGDVNLALGSDLLRISTITGFTDTIAPILSNAMLTLGLRKQTLVIVGISGLIKLGSFFPYVKYFDAYGMIFSGATCAIFVLIFYGIIFKNKFGVNVKRALINGLKILIISLISVSVFALIWNVLPIEYNSRIVILILLIAVGIPMGLTYLYLTAKFNLPQEILNIKDFSIKGIINLLKNKTK